MRRPVTLLIAAMLSMAPPMSRIAAGPREGEAKPAADERDRILAHLARAIGGEWVSQDGFEDPKATHSRTALEKGFVDGVLRERTWFAQHGGTQPLYDGVYFWNARSKQCEYVMVSSTGRTIKGTVTLEGETEVSYFTESGGDGEWTYRYHLRYVDDATQEKKIEEQKNGKWEEPATVVFHRVTARKK